MVKILLLALALTAPANRPDYHFDRIDIHHYRFGNGVHTRLIYWRWVDGQWRSYGSSLGTAIIEMPIRRGPRYQVRVMRFGKPQVVVADCLREYQSDYDPAAVDRERFPDVDRRWR